MQKKNIAKIAKKSFAKLALATGKVTANSACFSIWHQPKEPKAMNRFKF